MYTNGLVYDEIIAHRTALTSTLENCKTFVANLFPTSSDSDVSSFASGGFASDFEDGSDDQTCEEGTILGVEADVGSCGFSGNLGVAAAYCEDFPDAPCCLTRIEEGDSSALAITGDSASETSSVSSAPAGTSFIGILGAAIVVVAAVVGGAVVYRRRRRRHSHSRVGDKKSGILGMTASPSSSAGSSPTGSPDINSPRYVVIHEYAQTLPDELELRRGDIVTVGSSFDDGWCLAKNISTNKSGSCPLPCLQKSSHI
jgi:hypothetical protein